MSSDVIRAAVDLADGEPSSTFLAELRARLLAQGTSAVEPATEQPEREEEAEVIVEERVVPDIRKPRRRTVWLAAAAVLAALVGAGVVISLRDDPPSDDTLTDVDAREAQPLAEAALMTPEVFREGWSELDAYPVQVLAQINSETRATYPECAVLTSFGLMQPTTKSVTAHRDFVNGAVPMLHDVWVFASAEDASKAMDIIAGGIFPKCLFDLFDRTTARGTRVPANSDSHEWDVPNVSELLPHGDRQVIIGQKIDYSLYQGGSTVHVYPEAINVFVQVGRAIGFVDPQYLSDLGPNSNVERTVTAMTNQLEKEFGGR